MLRHARPHSPQCSGSDRRFTQALSHSRVPSGQPGTQRPIAHTPPRHCIPGIPQFSGSVSRSTHASPTDPSGGRHRHAPSMQSWSARQRAEVGPHAPGSVRPRVEPHAGSPGGHAHEPLMQACPAAQARPQAPQLVTSPERSRQREPQATRGIGHGIGPSSASVTSVTTEPSTPPSERGSGDTMAEQAERNATPKPNAKRTR